MEFPIDSGADAEGDHNSPGVPSSREEKVSSLKTGLVHVSRKMPKNAHVHFILGLMYQRMGQPQKAVSSYEKAEEILLRGDEDIDRPELLSLVQTHHAQCILLGSSEDYGSGKELEGKELEEVLCKLNDSMRSDVRQTSVWNTLGVLLLKAGHLQVNCPLFLIFVIVLGLGSLSDYEKQGLEALLPELKASIEKGIQFANKS